MLISKIISCFQNIFVVDTCIMFCYVSYVYRNQYVDSLNGTLLSTRKYEVGVV